MRHNRCLLGALLAVVSIVGYVVLALSGDARLEAARGVFLFAAPFIAMLLSASTSEKLNKSGEIRQQTHEHLPKRVDDVSAAATEERLKQLLRKRCRRRRGRG